MAPTLAMATCRYREWIYRFLEMGVRLLVEKTDDGVKREFEWDVEDKGDGGAVVADVADKKADIETGKGDGAEIEAKKAYIERRRQEAKLPIEINGKNIGEDLSNYDDGEQSIKGQGYKEIRDDIVEKQSKGIISNEDKNIIQQEAQDLLNSGKSLKETSEIIYHKHGIKVSAGRWQLAENRLFEINAKYDAEYVDAVKKGEMTKEQAMQALEQAGRKGSDAYAELAAIGYVAINNLFNENVSFANSVYEALGFKTIPSDISKIKDFEGTIIEYVEHIGTHKDGREIGARNINKGEKIQVVYIS